MRFHPVTRIAAIVVSASVILGMSLASQQELRRSAEAKAIVQAESKAYFLEMMQSKAVEEKRYKKHEQLKPKELKRVLKEAGFNGKALRVAWAVVMKESNGSPRAHNKNSATGDNSYGLFQINMIGSLGPARLEQFNLKKNSDLFDPVRNAEIAYFMSNKGKNWSAWGGMTDKTIYWMGKFPGKS